MNYRMSSQGGRAFALYLFSALALAQPADAFLQTTKSEGTIGKNVGGVWLAVHHIMPLFRVRLDRNSPEKAAPFDVGPIEGDLTELFAGKPQGVVITKLADAGTSARTGIFEGDIITKVNTSVITDVASYEKALESVKEWFLVTVRRTGLRYTTARIVKLEYKAEEGEVADGTSGLTSETVQFRMVDDVLPFSKDVEKTRETHQLFTPDDKAISALAADWWKLPAPPKPLIVNAEHRVVAEEVYDASLREDDNLDGTEFSIISTVQSNPLAGGGGKTISIYGISEITPKTMSGSYIETTLAQAPFPISIEFGGAFTMTKLADFSNKDLEYRAAQLETEKKTLESDDVKVAPDIPANIPKEEGELPKVAE